ncbi:hypothetical protein [uncultured Clostridium sp.]|uniref:hypothetical protein n=1 Tax=uncultured Clostridium sp. TaxID=59620 RepID=UPI00263640EE|nr:hypothetical protein [uncultured Clostridium sp.]
MEKEFSVTVQELYIKEFGEDKYSLDEVVKLYKEEKVILDYNDLKSINIFGEEETILKECYDFEDRKIYVIEFLEKTYIVQSDSEQEAVLGICSMYEEGKIELNEENLTDLIIQYGEVVKK